MEQREREPEHVLELLLQRVQRRALLVGHLLEDLSKGHASGLTAVLIITHFTNVHRSPQMRTREPDQP